MWKISTSACEPGIAAGQLFCCVFSGHARPPHYDVALLLPEHLDYVLELNYLRFLARSIASPDVFGRLWDTAIARLNRKAALSNDVPSLLALSAVGDVHVENVPGNGRDELILALGSGDVAVFPGTASAGLATILILSCYIPFPLAHGGAVRMYNLMRRAAGTYRQILITFVDELHTPPPELLEICAEVVQVRRIGSHIRLDRGRPDVVEDFDSSAFQAALQLTIRKWSPGIAQLEFTQMAQYAGVCAPAKTLLIEHDITIDLYSQLLERDQDWELRDQLRRWELFERKAWRDVDCVVAMSEKDRSTVAGAKRCQTLANGVDLDRYQPSPNEPDPARLLFIGSFAHLPNLLALDYFLDHVFPRLRHLSPILHVIAGSRHEYHFERQRDRIHFTLDQPNLELEGFVSDVRPAYRKATLVIAPLLASAGTNIKVLEAMAMGKAVVSTPGGINGLDELVAGRDVIVQTNLRRWRLILKHCSSTLLEDALWSRMPATLSNALTIERYRAKPDGAV
ncbi:MAG: glycosyltransferase [Bryobacteraceae bacterium]